MRRSASSERVRRLLVQRRARELREPLRRLTSAIAEWQRLDDADAIGVVRVAAGETEAEYGPAVLDLIAQAVAENDTRRIIEVFVTSSPAEHPPIGRQVIGEADARQQRNPSRI